MLIERLNAAEQGVVMGALLDGRGAEARLARLVAPTAERCRSAFSEIQQLEPSRRRRCVRRLSRRLFNPIPEHLEAVHPSWLQHLLEREPAPIVKALLSVLPPATIDRLALPSVPARLPELSSQILAQIFRSLLSNLEPMPKPVTREEGKPERPVEVIHWSAARLEAAINHLGCLALAALLRRTEAQLEKRVLERTEEPYRSKVVHAGAKAAELPPVPIRRLKEVASGTVGARMLFRLGAELLASGLPRATARQLAQRLPRELGSLILDRAAPAGSDTADTVRPAVLQLVRLADRWARGEELR